jgi:hypothetical protein
MGQGKTNSSSTWRLHVTITIKIFTVVQQTLLAGRRSYNPRNDIKPNST